MFDVVFEGFVSVLLGCLIGCVLGLVIGAVFLKLPKARMCWLIAPRATEKRIAKMIERINGSAYLSEDLYYKIIGYIDCAPALLKDTLSSELDRSISSINGQKIQHKQTDA